MLRLVIRLLPRSGALLFGAPLFGALLLSACVPRSETPPPEEAKMPRHVLFITVDTLRADHLGLYGYERDTSPVLDAFAQSGVTFDRAIAQWPKTGTSFASMFTGQYPQSTGLTHKAALTIPDEYLTLPEYFKEHGFTTVGVVSNAVLNQELGWNRGFDEYLETWKLAPEVTEDPVEYRKWIRAQTVNELALPLLEKHRDAERLFAWIHYSDPHAPYVLPDQVDNPFVDDAHYQGEEQVKLHNVKATALGQRRDLKYYVAQYDANVQYTDLYLGRLLDHVRELGILDNALVVFTADHGESLGEHNYFFGHGRLPYNDGVHVPLVVSFPPALAQGRRISGPVELVDLYPTFQEWVSPERPVPGLEGKSLWPQLRPAESTDLSPEPRVAFSQAGGGSPTTHFRSVQDENFKLIYHPSFRHRGKEIPLRWEFYHLREDPAETLNLADQDGAPEFRRLYQELQGWMKGSDWIRRPQSEISAQSQEIAKALKALGYME